MSVKKRNVPGSTGAASQPVIDDPSVGGEIWAPFRYPDQPRVKATRGRESTWKLWCFDTGANIAVTSPDDQESIERVTDDYDQLLTSAGEVSARVAILRTPAGLVKGLLSAGSPRILPGIPATENGLFYCERGRAYFRIGSDKLRQCVVIDDIPYLPSDVQALFTRFCRHVEDSSPGPTLDSLDEGQGPSLSALRTNADRPSTESQNEKEVSPSPENKSRAKKVRREITDEDNAKLAEWREHLYTHHPKRTDCEHCMIGKLPFTGHRRQGDAKKASLVGEKLYTDLCTSWPSAKGQGEKSFIGVLDEASGLIFFDSLRGQISAAVLESLLRILKELDAYRLHLGTDAPRFQVIKSDWGGEFTALNVRDGLAEKGVIFEHGVPSRHVASAERLVKQMAQGIRTLLHTAGLPAPFWTHAGRTFAHNMRCADPSWVAYSKSVGRPYKPRVFGQLVYVKLPEVPRTKADMPGTPCAFLSYEIGKTTCGMHVAFLDGSGKIATTLVDGRDLSGVFWPELKEDGSPPLAFQRVIRNLHILAIPGEDVEKASFEEGQNESIPKPCMETQPEGQEFFPGGLEGPRILHPPVRNPDSSCPACRGRKRAHTYGDTCALQGKKPPRQPAAPAKSSRRKQANRSSVDVSHDSMPRLSESAKQKVVQPDDTTSGAKRSVKSTFEQLPTAKLSTAGLSETVNVSLKRSPAKVRFDDEGIGEVADVSHPLPASTSVQNLSFSSSISENDFEKALPENGGGAENDFGKGDPARAEISKSEPSAQPDASNAAELFAKAALQELEAARLVHPDEAAFLEDVSESGPLGLHDLDSKFITKSAFVTRKMTRTEVQSEPGQKAIEKEMRKMCHEYRSFGKPIERKNAPKNATLSGLAMLSHVKHFEKAFSEWIFKGRAVILGNDVRPIHGSDAGAESDKQAENAATFFGADLAALEEARMIDIWSLVCGYKTESIDIENGYLQQPWNTSKAPPHFVKIPASLWKYLPAELHPDGLVDPVWPMLVCVYGHPLSGNFFIEGVLSLLTDLGYKPIGKVGSKALLAKKQTLVSAYVDDLKASGPDDQLAELWDALGRRYPLKDGVHICNEFLGVEILRSSTKIIYKMENYAKEILKTYQEFYGTPRASRIPIDNNLRTFARISTPPQKQVQRLLGMLLWLARTMRPDISFAVSCLGTRVSFWDAACDRELERLCSYVGSTASAGLQLSLGGLRPGLECLKHLKLTCYCDADWQAPRCQNGFLLAFQNSQANAFLTLHWGSRKQPFSAESAAAAETCAGYYALRESLPAALSWRSAVDTALISFVFGEHPPLTLCTDNSQVVSLSNSGESEKLFFLHKATNVRACFLRDAIEQGWVAVEKVETAKNPSNIFTKCLGRVQLEREARLAGLIFDLDQISKARAAIWQTRGARHLRIGSVSRMKTRRVSLWTTLCLNPRATL